MLELRQIQRQLFELHAKFNTKLCKIYAEINAKHVRLELNVLSLCKIYAKFNAKYVRSTLNSTQII